MKLTTKTKMKTQTRGLSRSLALLLIAGLAGACGSPSRAPAAGAGAAAAIPAAPDPALGKRVDAAVDAAMAAPRAVGAVVLIARDGKVVYARAAGFADREAKVPVREDTVFRLASMTKPITSVAALALVDQGKLSLEDPVTKWLPEFRPKLPDGREPVITVRHLLTHTSGLGYKFFEPADGPYHKAEVSDGIAEPGLAADENLRRLASAPLLHEPGAKWTYSLSTEVLGEVVARAGGGTLAEVIERLVTRPLAMTDTAFTVADRARLAWPYGPGAPPVRMTDPYEMPMQMPGLSLRFAPSRIFDPKSYPSGGAGLAGTARDYLRFLEALRTGGAPILSPASVRAAQANQVGELGASFLGPGTGFGFGFAVVLDPAAAQTRRGAGSFGWAGVYGTTFWIDPEARLSVVILTNVAGDVPLARDVEQAIYAEAP